MYPEVGRLHSQYPGMVPGYRTQQSPNSSIFSLRPTEEGPVSIATHFPEDSTGAISVPCRIPHLTLFPTGSSGNLKHQQTFRNFSPLAKSASIHFKTKGTAFNVGCPSSHQDECDPVV